MSAPGAVRQLNIHHSEETSLSAVWTRPVGEWDNFTGQLKDGDLVLDRRTLDHDARECGFNNLIPGHTYTITVTTNSGDQNNSAHITGKTCESLINHIHLTHVFMSTWSSHTIIREGSSLGYIRFKNFSSVVLLGMIVGRTLGVVHGLDNTLWMTL